MQVIGRRYDNHEVVVIKLADNCIKEVAPDDTSARKPGVPWIAPGFVDLQVNGYGGQEFNDLRLTADDVAQISLSLDASGVTNYCPTLTTHCFEMLSHALATIANACNVNRDVAERVCGIHLEGPYLSKEDGPRGAHPREHCRPPDWDEFCRLQDKAEGRICILTMSPEYDNSARFISQVVNSGVLVAIGHTAADSQQILAAVDAGASMSTHLGNGAHGQIRRHPNYIWDQLAEDRLIASLIVDGHHLPPSVVKCFLRVKGPDRCVLVSDITGMSGMPPGWYNNSSLGAVEVLEDGRLVAAGQRQYLAGAALPISVGVANVMRFADVALADAWEMASTRPAKLIGLPCGGFAIGASADLVLFDLPADNDPRAPINVRATFNSGRLVYGALWSP